MHGLCVQRQALQVLRPVAAFVGRDQHLHDGPPSPGLRRSRPWRRRLQCIAGQQGQFAAETQGRHDPQVSPHGRRRVAGFDGPQGVARDPHARSHVWVVAFVGSLVALSGLKCPASLAMGTNLCFRLHLHAVAEVKRRGAMKILSPDTASNGGRGDKRWTLAAELRGTTVGSLGDDSKAFRLREIESNPGIRACFERDLFPQEEVFDLRDWIGFNSFQAVRCLCLGNFCVSESGFMASFDDACRSNNSAHMNSLWLAMPRDSAHRAEICDVADLAIDQLLTPYDEHVPSGSKFLMFTP